MNSVSEVAVDRSILGITNLPGTKNRPEQISIYRITSYDTKILP